MVHKRVRETLLLVSVTNRYKILEFVRWNHAHVSSQEKPTRRHSSSHHLLTVSRCGDGRRVQSYFSLDIVGWIEKDGQTGFTNASEAVHVGDHLDNNTIIHSYSCNEFICKDSSLVVVPDATCNSKF